MHFIVEFWTFWLSFLALQVKQLLERKGEGRVIATCRNPNGAAGLLELKDKFSDRLDIHPLDLTIESTIEVSVWRKS